MGHILPPDQRLKKALGIYEYTSFTLLQRFTKRNVGEGFIAVRRPETVGKPRYGFPGEQPLQGTNDGQMSAIIVRLRKDGVWELQALESASEIRRTAKPDLSRRLARLANVRVEARWDVFNDRKRRGRYYYSWQCLAYVRELRTLAEANKAEYDPKSRERKEIAK